jgi:hypothetical protein
MRYEFGRMRARLRLFLLAPSAIGIALGALAAEACGSNAGNFYGAVDGGAQDMPDTYAPATDATPTDTGTDVAIADTGTDAPPSDAGPSVWPDCKTQPPNTTLMTLPEVWQNDDTSTPKGVFVTGVTVTAIGHGACTAGYACQLVVQDGSYATLVAGAHHAIKVFASATTSKYFTGLTVGDKIDVSGFAWRYTLQNSNELLIEVNVMLPGCSNKTGTNALTPVTGVTLDDFTVDHYEQTYGPLLVEVANVSGKYTGPANVTFGLYPTGVDGGFPEAGATDIVSLSPYFLPNGNFTGLAQGQVTKFTTITGIFDVFYAPPADGGTAATKYLELGPRTSADIVAM